MPKRLWEDEVLSKKSQCERQLCLGFIRRVLGGFLEGSRHVLGRISARSWRNFAFAGDEVLDWRVRGLCFPISSTKASKGFRKGVQREAKRTPGCRKGGLREAKIAPEAHQNREQNEGLHPSRFWKPPGKHWVPIVVPCRRYFGSQII